MTRYFPQQVGRQWAVGDSGAGGPRGTLTAGPLSAAGALDLAEVMNSLDAQEHWRREAALWPRGVG